MKLGRIAYVLIIFGILQPGKCEALPFTIYGFITSCLMDDPYNYFDSATGGGIGIETMTSPNTFIGIEYAFDGIQLSEGYSEVVAYESGPDAIESFRSSSLSLWVGHSLFSLTDFRILGKVGLGAANLSSDISLPQDYGWGTQLLAGLEGQLNFNEMVSLKIGVDIRNVKNDPGWVQYYGFRSGVAFAL